MTADKQYCALCGAALTRENGWKMPEALGGKYVPYCDRCQERLYRHLAGTAGYKLSMFLCAAAFQVPYRPDILPETKQYAKEKGVWGGYLAALRAAGYHDRDGKPSNFRDGLTDITKAFDGEYEALEVDDAMLSDEEYRAGHLAQVQDWGTGPEDRPYTQEDYDTLDGFYHALVENRVNVSSQAELAIKNISVMRLEQRKCLYSGDFAKAKQLEDIINKEMESEQLRKKDELPQDRVRMDDIVLAVERAGLHINDYEELKRELCQYMFHSPYGYTRDAADQMLLLIRNATAWNEGQMELDRLPDEFAVKDTLGEFAKEQDETEKKLYKDLQLAPLHMGD